MLENISISNSKLANLPSISLTVKDPSDLTQTTPTQQDENVNLETSNEYPLQKVSSSAQLTPEKIVESDGDSIKPSHPPLISLRTFNMVFPRVVVVIFLIILVMWIYQAEGGLGFEEATVFGWHALLMSLFVVVFTQEGVMAYSAPFLDPFTRNRTIIRYFHISCHVLGIICAIAGLVGIVYYKSLSPAPIVFPFFTMYTAHSWLGVCLLSLWTLQMAAGIYTHTIAKLSNSHKHMYLKYHRFVGKFIYGVALATCAMGFQDMQSSDLAYSTQPMPNMTLAEMEMMPNITGYFPNSNLAQYSSAGTLLLLLLGFSTFSTFIR